MRTQEEYASTLPAEILRRIDAAMDAPEEPQPKKLTLSEQIELFRQGVERRYREDAVPICQKYGLDVQADRAQVQKLLRATRTLETCKRCDGIICHQKVCCTGRDYETVSISDSGEVTYNYPCDVFLQREWKRNLPARYLGKTFDDYEQTGDNDRALNLAQWFLDKGDRSAYFYGGVGTGKTLLATLIGKELIRRGKSIVFGDVPSLLDELKVTFNDPNVSSQTVLRRYLQCGVLILDDVGAGKLSEWNVGILYQLINTRYNENQLTIITSNYSIEELGEEIKQVKEIKRFDAERITSRLIEVFHETSLGYVDRRRQKRGKV